ncbi:MAG: hypothetical protein AAB874_03970 [Patescibacteria group bacterium]
MAETTADLTNIFGALTQGRIPDGQQRLILSQNAASQLAKAHAAVSAGDFEDADKYLSTLALWESEIEGNIEPRRSFAGKVINASLRQGVILIDQEKFSDLDLIRRIATNAALVGDLVWEEGQRGNDEKFTPDFQRILSFCERVGEKKQAVVVRLVGDIQKAVRKGDQDAARAIYNKASAFSPNDKKLLDLKEHILTPKEKVEGSRKTSDLRQQTITVKHEESAREGLEALWPEDTDLSHFEAAERSLLVSLRSALVTRDYTDAMWVFSRLRTKHPDD